jgi:hypothetical protein
MCQDSTQNYDNAIPRALHTQIALSTMVLSQWRNIHVTAFAGTDVERERYFVSGFDCV